MKVGVALSSYLSDREFWLKIVNRFYDSLSNLKEINDFEFLCNWQNIPLDDKEVMDTIDRFAHIDEINSTWSYKYIMNHNYKPEISMCKIKNDSLMLDPDCDLYLYVDDDLYFREGAGENYKFVLDAFEKDDKLGLVMCTGYLGGYNYTDRLRYDNYKYYLNNLGLFFRNIHRCSVSPIYPEGLFEYHQRSFEDVITDFEINRAGYRCATKFNCSIGWTPREEYFINRDIEPTNEFSIHHPTLSLDSLERYIKEEYGLEVHLEKAIDIRQVKRKLFKEEGGLINDRGTNQ